MIAESAVDPKVLNLVEQVSWRAAAASARGIFSSECARPRTVPASNW
jgi:hypothetical protein